VKDPSVDVNLRDPEDEMNALLKLSRHYRHENLIQLVTPLIKRGIDVNATDPNGWNALHNLCEYYGHQNFRDLILLLKESNIDMEARTKEGYTALFMAHLLSRGNPTMRCKSDAVIEILLIDEQFSEVK